MYTLKFISFNRILQVSQLINKYLRRLCPREFNSYGSRRGNDEIMTRGTFANIRLVNKLVSHPGPVTVHIPSLVQVRFNLRKID